MDDGRAVKADAEVCERVSVELGVEEACAADLAEAGHGCGVVCRCMWSA